MAKKRARPIPESEPQIHSDDPSDDPEDSSEAESSSSDNEVEDEDEEEQPTKEEGKEQQQDEDDQDEDEVIDPSDREALRRLLEPFAKDQLIEIIKDAALKNPSIASRIADTARADPVHRKIFVHGLSWDATTDDLCVAFSPFGEIEECRAVVDRATGRCKGYGFVLFRSRSAARRALKEPQKKIGNRMTNCQLAAYGAPPSNHGVPEPTGRKIFINNIGEGVNPERLRAFFAKFGEIEEGPLGYDRATGRLKGFAIFIYKTVEGCKKALEEPKKMFEGSELHVQRAMEGLKPKTAAAQPVGGGLPSNDLTMAYASAPVMGFNAVNPGMGLLGQVGTMPPQHPFGVGMGHGGPGLGLNAISPSVIGNYASQAAVQGLGAYTSGQAPSTAGKTQAGFGPSGTISRPYTGR